MGAAAERAGASGPVVDVEDLRFAWRSGEQALVDIDRFEIAPGERLFISGPSGSGKSTLLSLLGGVVVPQRGKVEVLGTDLSRLSGRERDRFRGDHVGFVFQMFNLVPYLSMVDNVTLPCRFSRRRRRRAEARSARVDTEARRLLHRLELDRPGLRERSVTDLSIGQQQRVAVARALIGAPELVIADEPTSALDGDTRERFLGLLFEECGAENATLLFVSHELGLGTQFDRRVAMSELGRASGGKEA